MEKIGRDSDAARDLEGARGGRRRDAGDWVLPEDPAGSAEGAAEVSYVVSIRCKSRLLDVSGRGCGAFRSFLARHFCASAFIGR